MAAKNISGEFSVKARLNSSHRLEIKLKNKFGISSKKLFLITAGLLAVLVLSACSAISGILATVTPTSTPVPPTITPTSAPTITPTATIIPLTPELQELQALDSIAELDDYLINRGWKPDSQVEIDAYGETLDQSIVGTLELNGGNCGEYERLAYFVMKDNISEFRLVDILFEYPDGSKEWHGMLIYRQDDGTYDFADMNTSKLKGQDHKESYASIPELLKAYSEIYDMLVIKRMFLNSTESDLDFWSQVAADPDANWITGDTPIGGLPTYGEEYDVSLLYE